MAAVSLFWNTNIAALTSFENALLLWLARLAFCTLHLKIYNFSGSSQLQKRDLFCTVLSVYSVSFGVAKIV